MYYIGDVICLKTNKKLNIIKGEIYTAYKEVLPQDNYGIVIDDDHSIDMNQKRFDEYFKIREL